MALWFWSIIAVLIVIAVLLWFFFFRFRAYTDDAYVEGNLVTITPLQDGFIEAIHTDDTFLVEKGELIIEMDRTDAIISLEIAKKQLANVVRGVSESFHQVFVYRAEHEIRKAEFIKAAQDYKHREDVIQQVGVSLEDFEHAVAAFKASFFALWQTENLYDKALSVVQGTSVKNHPSVQAAAAELRNAWVRLYRCNIYSPVTGLAAQRTIQVGMWVKAGQPLLAIIPLDQIWVNANYKETAMKHMRIGQSVKLTSDLYGRGVVYHGKVVGLPGGAGNAFSLLPPQNLSGNWIKIVQRLPVRVQLDPDELQCYPLRVGLSMESTVDLTSEGKLVPEIGEAHPTYATTIFQKEEIGDESLINEIITQNLDPTLNEYAENPLCIERGSDSRSLDPDLEELKLYALKLIR